MKICIFSDLHLNINGFDPFDNHVADSDIIIAAGDINKVPRAIDYLNKFGKPCLYILGNHELGMGNHYQKILQDGKNLSNGTNVTILEKQKISFGTIDFLGCSLWTDFRVQQNLKQAKIAMTNKLKITNNHSISTDEIISEFRQSVNWLRDELTTNQHQTKFVITHFAPTRPYVPIQFQKHPVSGYYNSGLKEFIMTHQPSYWIHGHTHERLDYTIGKTRILSNAYGVYDQCTHARRLLPMTIEIPAD